MRILASAILACVVTACGGDNLNGKWKGNGKLHSDTLQADVGYTAAATFKSATSAYQIDLTIGAPINGTMTMTGTYSDDGKQLTLKTVTASTQSAGITVEAAPPAGYTCLNLSLTEVCFKTPQTNAYTVEAQTLTINVQFASADPGVTPLVAVDSKTPATATLTKQ